MKVRFLGPVGKVTGSCTWLWDEERNWSMLVDCGMQQGEPNADKWNACEWPFDPKEIKLVVLTHAHIDHCGLLPMLYKKGFEGRVYCAKETRQIATLLLKDAARLGGAGFYQDDVDKIVWHEPGAGEMFFGKLHPLDQDLFVSFYRSGHIVGAVSAVIHWGPPKSVEQRSIAFSGDLGPNQEDLEELPFLRHRMGVPSCEFAVVESTYGSKVRNHDECTAMTRRDQLRRLMDQCLRTGGVLGISAFSLGRTQDVLFDLHWIVAEDPDRYGSMPVFLDSPTARKLHGVILTALERTECNGRKGKVRPLWLGKQMFRWFDLDGTDPEHTARVLEICKMTLGHCESAKPSHKSLGNDISRSWRSVVRPPASRAEVDEVIARGPAVLVFSSGTCDGGPVAHWLPKLLGNARNTIALSGYCHPSTVGGKLLALTNVPKSERRRLSGNLTWHPDASFELAEVRAGVTALQGYSAHADQQGLMKWISDDTRIAQRKPLSRGIFIQHGTDVNRHALCDAINARAADINGLNMHVALPDAESVFDLDKGGEKVIVEDQLLDLDRQIAQLLERKKRMGRG